MGSNMMPATRNLVKVSWIGLKSPAPIFSTVSLELNKTVVMKIQI